MKSLESVGANKFEQKQTKNEDIMQVKRFLGNIAKTTLAIGALVVSASAVETAPAAPMMQDPCNNNMMMMGSCDQHMGGWGCSPHHCCEQPQAPCLGWGYLAPAYLTCGQGCDPCCGGLDNLRFRVDFLWWRAYEEGLALGYVEELDEGNFGVGVRSHKKDINPRYEPGFRLGLASVCPCDCGWDVALNWTHFHTKAYAKAHEDCCDFGEFHFDSLWERFADLEEAGFARSRWNLDLDLLDLEFGRKFYIASCLVARPYFGLRGARVDQSYRVYSLAEFGTSDGYETIVRSKNNFLAVGPRVGAYLELDFGCGFSLFGDAAASILFGKTDVHSSEFVGIVESVNESFLEYQEKSSPHRNSRAVTDLAFGIQWDHCCEWCNRCHPVSIALAWEHHAFWDFNQFNFRSYGQYDDGQVRRRGVGEKSGNLYTQGLTLSATIGF